MPRPTARVLALLELLQAGGTHRVGDLAARLGVDERTVRRYVGHLADLDVPVESVRGRYGGIRLVAGYRLPPLMFTDDEALAVVLGLLAARRAGSGTGSALAAETAAAKVRRVLPAALARRLAALLETAAHTSVPRAAASTPGAATLLAVAEAARDRRALAVDYTDSRDVRTRRTVHPYGVVAHSGRWYLVGADPARGGVRAFRLDRVGSVEPLAAAFEVPADVDPAATVLAAIAGAPRRHQVSLVVQGSAEEVRREFPAGLATVEEDPAAPDRVRVLIQAERLDWVPAVLAGIDRPFSIVEPAELRPLVRALAARLTAAADQ